MKNRIPKSAITEKQLRRLLREEAAETAPLSAWAVDNGITSHRLCRPSCERLQSAGLQIPEALGYYPQTIYLPRKEEPICTERPHDHRRNPRRSRDDNAAAVLRSIEHFNAVCYSPDLRPIESSVFDNYMVKHLGALSP
jgi:hypothetical protein